MKPWFGWQGRWVVTVVLGTCIGVAWGQTQPPISRAEQRCTALLHTPASLTKAVFHRGLPVDAVQRLGWMPTTPTLCGGRFQPLPQLQPSHHERVDVWTQAPVWASPTWSYWSGPVTLRHPGWEAHLPRMCTHSLGDGHDASRAHTMVAPGWSEVTHPPLYAWGNRLTVTLPEQQLTLRAVVWRWLSVWRNDPVVWWGTADGLQQTHQPQPHATMHRVILSTCQPEHPTWWLSARRITLNQPKGWGQMVHAVLHMGRVPVFYWPYWRFPIDGHRHTGFLMPRFSSSNTHGWHVAWPWYQNVMRPMDVLLTPHWYSRRGLGWDVRGRYALPWGLTTVHGWTQWHDQAWQRWRTSWSEHLSASERRTLQAHRSRRWAWSLSQVLHGQRWRHDVQWQAVSDPYWVRDFPDRSGVLYGPHLPAFWAWSWDTAHTRFRMRWASFHTQHPLDQAAVAPIYHELPRVRWDLWHPWGEHQGRLGIEWLRFLKPIDPATGATAVSGQRWTVRPSWTWRHPLGPGWSTLTHRWVVRGYQLHHTPGTWSTQPTFAIPTTTWRWSGTWWRRWSTRATPTSSSQHGVWWVKPTSLLAWVPFVQQDALPVVDTVEPPLTVDRLLKANRYVGGDRVGDTQRAVVALSTGWRPDGTLAETPWSLQLAQAWQRRRPRVCLPNDAHCGAYGLSEHWLPTVADVRWQRGPWSATMAAAYSFERRHWSQMNANLQRSVGPKEVWSLGWLVDRSAEPHPVRDVTASWSHRWTPHWQSYVDTRFGLRRHRFKHAGVGLAYQGCCWRLSLVHTADYVSETRDGQARYERAFMFQFALRGLGSLGRAPF